MKRIKKNGAAAQSVTNTMGFARGCLYITISLLFIGLKHTYAENHDLKINRPGLSEKQLQEKREGGFLAAFGAPAYSPDLGVIVALMGAYYNNGSRDDELFAYTPYKHALTAALTWSTKGMYSLLADWDAPYFKDTDYRVRMRFWYQKNITEQYFGVGEETLNILTNPDGTTYEKFNDYNDSLMLIENGETNAYYNFYLNESLLYDLGLDKDIMGGLFRISGGVSASKVWIEDYTGEKVPGKEELDSDNRTDAEMKPTKLQEDYLAGKIEGFSGGINNSVRIGLAYDIRDLEPNPRKGMFHDISYLLSNKTIGSEYDYTITTLTTRFYGMPLKKIFDAIFACRLSYSVKNGNIPFFSMNYMPTTDKHIYGLGGDATMRGFRQSRFQGPVMAMGNFEVRYPFIDFKVGKTTFDLMVTPFVDFGRVYDKVENTVLEDFKYSYGAGLRTAINQSIVFSFDFGSSEEEQMSLYMSYGHIF